MYLGYIKGIFEKCQISLDKLIRYVVEIKKVGLWKEWLISFIFTFILAKVTHKPNPYNGMESHG